ncbi:hypothetical protein GCM10010347_21590 [Streptomyces cirratus]|uniref:Uncharacterized protein n=1 Tax=Streptomyces cirratus TaxID=68187 RepID=A0ABQ3ESS7_9ACTN|nr:hypothetical protein GCM10010347_21590 [Streptomyces cirratus]
MRHSRPTRPATCLQPCRASRGHHLTTAAMVRARISTAMSKGAVLVRLTGREGLCVVSGRTAAGGPDAPVAVRVREDGLTR